MRLNAMTHGILARLAVLPHEDAGAFSDLLAALVVEHPPSGMTEQHLVEELASITGGRCTPNPATGGMSRSRGSDTRQPPQGWRNSSA